MKPKSLLLLVAIVFSGTTIRAQKETLINKHVSDLIKAGLDADLVISKINASSCRFDLSTTALIALKNDKVPAPVIQAMMNKMEGKPVINATPPAPVAPAAPVIVTASPPASPLEGLATGIYFEEQPENYRQLESSVFSQTKTGSGFLTGLTYGVAKAKQKAVLSGIHASLEIKSGSPVFYFVFPKPSPNDNSFSVNAADGRITSPKEFALVKFKVVNTSKSKGREVVTGSFSGGGVSGGLEGEEVIPFRFGKLTGNIYKISFEKPLEAGEYAFMHAGGAASYGAAAVNRAYDFSIIK